MHHLGASWTGLSVIKTPPDRDLVYPFCVSLAHGWSAEEMCRHHPYLQLAEAHAALAYYFDHQDEIDAEIRAELQRAEAERRAAQPSPFFLRLRTKGLL